MMATWSVQESTPAGVARPPAPPWILAFLGLLILAVMVLRNSFSRTRRTSEPAPPDPLQKVEVERLDPGQPVAVFLVGGENRLEPASIRVFGSTYAQQYRQILFLSVGVYDYEVMDSGVGAGGYADPEKAKHLRIKTRLALDPYLAVAHELGVAADCRVSVGTDPLEEIDRMSTRIALAYPKAVFFVTKLVFRRFNWFHRLFRAGTGDAIRKRLERKGFPVTVIPLVLPL